VWLTGLAAGDRITVPGSAPAAAIGWNVYLGPVDGVTQLQNETPLAVGAAWTKPEGDVMLNRPVKESQVPDYLVIERRIIPRG
jgi:hypothetical protein